MNWIFEHLFVFIMRLSRACHMHVYPVYPLFGHMQLYKCVCFESHEQLSRLIPT